MVSELKLKLFLKGISGRRVAEVAGVTEAYVSQCLNGHKRPSPKVLQALEQLGIKLEGSYD